MTADWSVSHKIGPREKQSAPLRCGLSSRICDHFLCVDVRVYVSCGDVTQETKSVSLWPSSVPHCLPSDGRNDVTPRMKKSRRKCKFACNIFAICVISDDDLNKKSSVKQSLINCLLTQKASGRLYKYDDEMSLLRYLSLYRRKYRNDRCKSIKVIGDWRCQWQRAIFDPLQNRHPSTDHHNICHR